MFPSSDFYQILCRYTKFYADSEFNLKKKEMWKKSHFLKKQKNWVLYLIPDTQLFLKEFALFDISTENRILMAYFKEKPLKNTI